jgi:hypothetical protein
MIGCGDSVASIDDENCFALVAGAPVPGRARCAARRGRTLRKQDGIIVQIEGGACMGNGALGTSIVARTHWVALMVRRDSRRGDRVRGGPHHTDGACAGTGPDGAGGRCERESARHGCLAGALIPRRARRATCRGRLLVQQRTAVVQIERPAAIRNGKRARSAGVSCCQRRWPPSKTPTTLRPASSTASARLFEKSINVFAIPTSMTCILRCDRQSHIHRKRSMHLNKRLGGSRTGGQKLLVKTLS